MFLTQDTNYSIDNFNLSTTFYFLTHFHSDHYYGLTKKFDKIIFCSQTTAKLAMLVFKISNQHFKILQLYEWYQIEEHRYVMAINANHCPGAVCFIFSLSGIFYFHCGDFRCSAEFYDQFLENKNNIQDVSVHASIGLKKYFVSKSNKIEYNVKECQNNILEADKNQLTANIHTNKKQEQVSLPDYRNIMKLVYDTVFIDNTYEGFKNFDSQLVHIHRLLKLIDKKLDYRNYLVQPKFIFLFATYCIGKEKIFLTVAEYLNFTIYANKYKMDRLNCICPESRSILHLEVQGILEKYNKSYKKTTNVFDRLTNIENNYCQIRLVSMVNIRNKIQEMTRNLDCDRVFLFVGTGWHEKTIYRNFVKDSGRTIRNGIEIVYFPYSEHSSSEELLKFKETINTCKIINTVKNKNKIELRTTVQ